MNFPSAGTPDFWRCYRGLPELVQLAARKAFQLWRVDAFHPSLHFKKIGTDNWSVRVGIHYRAVGKFSGNTFVWNWIGSHEEYNKSAF